ncbi:MAG TPA: phage tail tape measure protein, partial [Methanosarcinales archaeon]|nr:phage tail tape measure protein [Methanosarcinales archaeon]
MTFVRGDNSLKWATSVDTRGLAQGAKKSEGILRGFASRVDKLDIFAGLAASAVYAMTKISSSAKKTSEQFEQAMKEVQTISDDTKKNFEGMAQSVIDLGKDVPTTSVKMAQALYQIVSASYDGAAGLAVLQSSSIAAVAGVTEVETAADGLTTILNAWKISATDVDKVSDKLFKTVKLGKTTFAELSNNISTVAPLAATMNVSLDEVLGALATLTKQGTPTSVAMTQIRSSLIALSDVLGDGWSDVMTFQEGLIKMNEKAGGSINTLKEMVGRIEGVNGVLGLTGANAKQAAEDFGEIENAAGSAKEAYDIMIESAENQSALLKATFEAALKPLGDFLKDRSTEMKKFLIEAFETGKIEKWAKVMAVAVVSLVAYKTAVGLNTISSIGFLRVIVKVKRAIIGMNAAIKANPWALVAAGIAAAVTALALFNRESRKLSHEQQLLGNIQDRVNENLDIERQRIQSIREQLALTEPKSEKRKELIIKTNEEYPELLKNIDAEKASLEDLNVVFDEYIENLEKRVKLQVIENELIDLNRKKTQLSIDLREGEIGVTRYDKQLADLNKQREIILEELNYQRDLNNFNTKIADLLKVKRRLQSKLEQTETLDLLQIFGIAPTNPQEFALMEEQIKQIAPNIKSFEDYQKLISAIGEDTTESLISLINKQQVKINEALKEIDLEPTVPKYEDTERYFNLVKKKIIEIQEVSGTLPVGSINEKIREVTILTKKWKAAQTEAERDVWYKRKENAQKELNLMMNVNQKKIDLERDYYDEVQRMSMGQLYRELTNINKRVKAEKAANGILTDEYKKLVKQQQLLQEELSEGVTGWTNNIANGLRQISFTMSKVGGDVGEEYGEMIAAIGDIVGMAGTAFEAMAQGDTATAIQASLNMQLRLFEAIYEQSHDITKIMEKYRQKLENINEALMENQRLLETYRGGDREEIIRDRINLLEAEQAQIRANIKTEEDRKKFIFFDATDKAAIAEMTNEIRNSVYEMEDLQQELADILSGGITQANIADKIADAFAEGKTSVEDFANYSEQILKQAVLEVFKAAILGDYIDEAKKILEDILKDDKLTDEEIQLFNNAVGAIGEQAQAIADKLNFDKLFGVAGEEEDPNSLTGAIKRELTEE